VVWLLELLEQVQKLLHACNNSVEMLNNIKYTVHKLGLHRSIIIHYYFY